MKGTMVDAGRMRWVQGNQDGSVSDGGGGGGGVRTSGRPRGIPSRT